MSPPALSEADALLALARSLGGAREDLDETVRAVEGLVAGAVAEASPPAAERGFEAAARRLRAGWLRAVAAESARVLRSPVEREVSRLERSRHDAYGYERDFQPESLEARCRGFFGAPPAGWAAEHVLFSSGQAALTAILLQLAEGRAGKLRAAHVGAYFETRELAGRVCALADEAAAADCVIVEPVACDGRFSAHDPAAIGRGLRDGQVMIIDETLSAPRTRADAVLGGVQARGGAVIRLVSGLKLLQQGLELANVGIVSLFAKDADEAAGRADGLRRYRTLTGAGLRFVDALALEAPFFLDRAATGAYADRVFAHNGALARAAAAGGLFKPMGEIGGQAAPYCAFELARGNSAEALEALAGRMARAAEARGLLFERGGSFGFRSHRYEVIEPESGAAPFLRVAMGARGGHSCDGVIAMMAEIAAGGD